MSSPSQEPTPPLTIAQVQEWIHTATRRRLELYLHATEPYSSARAQAFWELGELCKDAIEEVRVISAQLGDESQAARNRSAEIVAESAQLIARYTTSGESQFLQIFKGEKRN